MRGKPQTAKVAPTALERERNYLLARVEKDAHQMLKDLHQQMKEGQK